MAFDEKLATRVREELKTVRGVEERRMFGGLIFMVNGNMAAGIHKTDLVVRVGAAASDAALRRPGARVFDLAGKPMKAWVLVAADAVARKSTLERWVQQGVEFARCLPKK
jgi:TfoX/Sxy family transcriptional regulator of competence genes